VAGKTFDRTENFEEYEIYLRTTKDEVPPQYVKNVHWREVGPYGKGWFANYTDDKGDIYTVPVNFDQHYRCWTEAAT